MSFTLVQSATANGGTVGFSSPVTAGNVVVVLTTPYTTGGTPWNVSGMKLDGNAGLFEAAVQIAVNNSSYSLGVAVWFCNNSVAGSSVTIQGTGLGWDFGGTIIYEFAVDGVVEVDQIASFNQGTGNTTSYTSGLTPETTADIELWVGGGVTWQGLGSSPAGFTCLELNTYSIGGYQLVSAEGQAVFTGTCVTGPNNTAAVATFKEVAAIPEPGSVTMVSGLLGLVSSVNTINGSVAVSDALNGSVSVSQVVAP